MRGSAGTGLWSQSEAFWRRIVNQATKVKPCGNSMTLGQAGDKVPPMKPRPSPARTAPDPEKPAGSYLLAGQMVEAPALACGLHIAATPIGNLGDITLRALEALAGADVIACEDTRVTRKLLERYGIETPLTPYHEHNAGEARPKILRRLEAGEAVVLVSDAGTPLVSDPGFKLVTAVRE